MKFISIFNDVLGPVMRGPSSSHTAGSYHIGTMVRSLMENHISGITFTFDPNGSYGRVYRQQGVDLAFAAGIMGWKLTDERFFKALEIAAQQGLEIQFRVAPLPNADHPNSVQIDAVSPSGEKLSAEAKSIGGGMILFTRLDNWEVELTGKAYECVVVCETEAETKVKELLLDVDDAVSHPRETGLNKSFLGGQGGRFFKKAPLAAGGKEAVNRKPLIGAYYFAIENFYDAAEKAIDPGQAVLFGFSGVGDNRRFRRDLSDFNLTGFQGYKDHFAFTEADIRELDSGRRQLGAQYLVCTEKDYVKIMDFDLRDIPLLYVRNVIKLDVDIAGLIPRDPAQS